jgi:hypothetical protein
VTGQDPTVQHGGPHDATLPQPPGDEKTLVLGVPAASVQAIPMPAVPVQAPPQVPAPRTAPSAPHAAAPRESQAPTPPEPEKPEKWEGRVRVAGASGPGQKKAAAPVAQTQKLARYADATPTAVAPRARPAAAPAPKRPPKRTGRRFFTALLALILILAVPVVSAYVAYKLTSGENPFQWPPTMDLSRVF